MQQVPMTQHPYPAMNFQPPQPPPPDPAWKAPPSGSQPAQTSGPPMISVMAPNFAMPSMPQTPTMPAPPSQPINSDLMTTERGSKKSNRKAGRRAHDPPEIYMQMPRPWDMREKLTKMPFCASSTPSKLGLWQDYAAQFTLQERHPLALERTCEDMVLAQMAQRLHLGPEVMADLHRHLREPCATMRAGLPPHLGRALRALHLDTHWHIGDQPDACRTTIGTRPGDAFADVIFGYLWSRVLQEFRAHVETLCPFDVFPREEDLCLFGQNNDKHDAFQPFVGPCWMDDLCVVISADSCQELVRKTTFLTGELLDQCISHGMTPNLAACKTEIILALRGPGAQKAKTQHYGPTAPKALHIAGEYGSHSVRLVSQHTHLGGVLHHRGDRHTEIKRRVAIAHTAFTAHRKLLFANKNITLQRRVGIFRCIVLSKLLSGTESWVIDDVKTKERLHSAIIALYRRLLGHRGDAHHTDASILHATGLPSPSELLRIQRLRHLGTLQGCKSLVDWGLLNEDKPWIILVEDDLRWLWHQIQGNTHLPDPTVRPAAWLDLINRHPGYWKRLIRRGMTHACRHRKKVYSLIAFHQDVLGYLKDQGFISANPTPTLRPEIPSSRFGCMSCQLRSKSKGGEGAHMNRVHGQVNPVRHLLQGTQCLSCMKEYFTATKLKAHLLHSTFCPVKDIDWNQMPLCAIAWQRIDC